MSVSPCAFLEGEMETLEGAVVVVEERDVRADVAREEVVLPARRFAVRREDAPGAARRWGRAMTNGMRLAGCWTTALGPRLAENGRVRYRGEVESRKCCYQGCASGGSGRRALMCLGSSDESGGVGLG